MASASTTTAWTLYYSNEGYPYYFNSLTNESVWADTTSKSEPTFPKTLDSHTTSNEALDEMTGSGESSSEDSEDDEEDDDDEVDEKLFLEYIQSSDGIAAIEVIPVVYFGIVFFI